MVNVKILILMAIVPIAIAAMAGAASASITASVDSIQANGHYIGVPTILNGDTYTYGYNYTFIPDGTYTISGKVANNADATTHVGIAIYSKSNPAIHWISVYVPPQAWGVPTTQGWSYTLSSSDTDFTGEVGIWNEPWSLLDFSGVDVVNAPAGQHTIDEGPMSGMSVIYNNGVLSSNATVIYSLNVTSDDYKALYTNGKMDFKGSPLYSFLE